MNKIFRIVWSEVSQAWIAVSELTKKHKKRASVTAVTAVLVAGVLPSLAEASGGDSDFGPVAREDLGTDYYFRVTTANVGESDDNDHYRGCKNGNVDSECPSTEMNIGTLGTDKDPEKDTSDNSRLVLEGGNGIRLEKDADGRHKITFKAPVEAAEGSNAISIEQPIEGEKAGHTIIKSEIKSGSADKIKVDSVDGVTTITWVGGDTAGGAAGGGTSVAAGDGISVSTDNKVSVNAKNKGGLTVNGDGVSVTTDNTTITVDAATGGVKAVTGDFKVDAATGDTVANDNDGDKLTTVTNVAKAINDAKVKVTEGNGAKVEHDKATNSYKVSAKVEKDKGLVAGADGLSVRGGNGVTVDGSGVSVHANANGGIKVDGDGVSVNAKNKGGLTVNGDGVSVTTDNTTITVDAATGGVKAVTGDFKVDAATGDTVANDNDGDKLTTVTNVAKAINDAKVKVEAGSGISVEHNPVSNAYTVFAPFEKTENDKGTTVTFKGKITTEHPNGETKLTGIAAGDISPTSSDAVNGAQIYGLNRGATTKVENVTVAGNTYNNVIVSNDGKNTPLLKTYNTQDKRTVLTNSVYEAIYNMNEYGIKFFHVNDGTENAKREGHSENDSSASGKYATAIGALSDASGKNAVAMGFGSTVTGDNSIAIGTGNQVEAAKSGAFGDPNIINGKDVNNVAVSGSYAVGNDNIIDSSNTFVLGNDINNKGNSTPVGHTVENSVYLGNKTTARGGDGSQTAALKNIKHDGSEGTTTTAGSIGTVNEAIVNGMSYGGFAGAKGHGVVSVGAADAERRIQNVAAGEISATSTDAINGSQLYSISSRLGNNMNSLNDRINKVGKRADAGTASAIAMANLLQSYRPGLSAATAAVGQYRGQSAIAVGYSRLSDNGKYGVKFSLGANTQGNVGAGAGVAYFW
ncbi:ESPR-type extended signal peptide-containing protein [Haemophilus haemolyticus]|uniref:YadA-like family protein n=1 Tax=Haemophilus haemolyticus TaxID=726 RepID=A0A852PTJ0_HAEHA|nr:ESPR-type extended signal peptide-containing protein [Haemophilus haemolyticus]NYA27770.1 YadA-like family protein [Haemophilus haemolyticus]